jgi:hypothetical protein
MQLAVILEDVHSLYKSYSVAERRELGEEDISKLVNLIISNISQPHIFVRINGVKLLASMMPHHSTVFRKLLYPLLKSIEV